MKKATLLLTLFLSFLLSTVFAQSVTAVNYKQDGFSITFPGEPVAGSKKMQTDIGELLLKTYSYSVPKDSDNDNKVYAIITTEYPDSFISSKKGAALNELFRNGIDGAVKRVSGTLISEKEIVVQGFPGRDISSTIKDGAAIIYMRMIFVHNSMYMMQVITLADKKGNKQINDFFNSLKLES